MFFLSLKILPLPDACSEQVHRNLISPPSCGRAAYYRSIIIPLARLRVMEVLLPYQCSWFCLPYRRIAARCQGNVSVEAVYLSRFMAQGCLYKQRQWNFLVFEPFFKKIIKRLRFSKFFIFTLLIRSETFLSAVRYVSSDTVLNPRPDFH